MKPIRKVSLFNVVGFQHKTLRMLICACDITIMGKVSYIIHLTQASKGRGGVETGGGGGGTVMVCALYSFDQESNATHSGSISMHHFEL